MPPLRRPRSAVLAAALSAVVAVPLVAVTGATPAQAAVPPAPGPDISITGSGWGHGVGMSQYGARAMAQQGRSAAQILGHYYPGVTVGPSSLGGTEDATVAVDLFRGRPVPRLDRVEVEARAVGAGAASVVLRGFPGGAAQDNRLTPGTTWLVFAEGPSYVVRPRNADGTGGAPLAVSPQPFQLFTTDANSLIALPQLPAPTYKHGTLTISGSAGAWAPVLTQPMGLYLRGIAEVPSDWEPAALQAQAITARTYAARSAGRVLLATPANQAYSGWAKESAGGGWVAAVQATAGVKVTYQGALAETYYSSSHGLGRTENSEDSWAFSASLPYLRSVEDPFSSAPGTGNPYTTWTAKATNPELAALMGLARVNSVTIASRTAGGSPRALVVDGWRPDGSRVTCTWSGGQPCGSQADGKGAGARMRTGLPLLSGGTGGRLRSSQISSITVDPFGDDEASFHQFNIGVIAALGITGGRTPGVFDPRGVVTRGELAAFLARSLGLAPDTGRPRFSDVDGTTHEGSINALAAAGRINGFPDGSFRPGQPVTRAQMASFLALGFGIPEAAPDRFDDVAGTGVHRARINGVAARGIAAGCDADSYCPGDLVTREQMATFLARARGLGD